MSIELTADQRRRMALLTEAIDRAIQSDRLFFERFPHRSHRVRLASQAEIAQRAILLSNDAGALPNEFRHFVAVRNIAAGVRLRNFTILPEGAETDLDEIEACAVYESAANEKTRWIEAQLRKAVARRDI
jgi:hypothetical protein